MAIWSWQNNYQEKQMNKDQIKGWADQPQGKAKEETGKLLDDKGMEIEENVQKNVGKAQGNFGDLKSDIKKGKLHELGCRICGET